MEFENLLTLIKTVSDSDLTDFAYEENGTSIRLKKKKETVVVSGASSNVPVMGLQTVQPLGQITESEAKMEKDIADGEPEGMLIKSPLVGTFYAAPAEDADPFVSVNDATAARSFTLAQSSPDTMLFSSPQDFQLWYLGSMRNTSGEILSTDGFQPHKVCDGQPREVSEHEQ